MRKFITFILILLVILTGCAPDATSTPIPEETQAPTVETVETVPTALTAPDAATPATDTETKGKVRKATITSVLNEAIARALQTDEFIPAQKGMVLQVSGGVQTQDNGRASLTLLPEGTIIRVGPNTIFTVQEIDTGTEAKHRIKLDLGQIWILLKGGSVEVETPSGVAAVRGSLLGIAYNPDEKQITATCLEGHCNFSNQYGQVDLTDKQSLNFDEDEDTLLEIVEMSNEELQDWVNENPDAWEYFGDEYEEAPDWLPDPDLEFLSEFGDYFDWSVEDFYGDEYGFDGYYTDGYYDDGYYTDGYYADDYYSDGYYSDGYYNDSYYNDGYNSDGYYGNDYTDSYYDGNGSSYDSSGYYDSGSDSYDSGSYGDGY